MRVCSSAGPTSSADLRRRRLLQVLLTAGGTAKLADVGLSKLLHQSEISLQGVVGTFAW